VSEQFLNGTSAHNRLFIADLIGQINSLLKRAYKNGFSSTLHTVENMADVAVKALFEKPAAVPINKIG